MTDLPKQLREALAKTPEKWVLTYEREHGTYRIDKGEVGDKNVVAVFDEEEEAEAEAAVLAHNTMPEILDRLEAAEKSCSCRCPVCDPDNIVDDLDPPESP